MRALVITRHGGPEVLQVQERPAPTPGPGEVAIRVRASGVNFADLMARMGLYPEAPKPPCVVGYEVAGTVEALGEGVSGLVVGQRVLAATTFGGYAEVVVTPAPAAAPLPDGVSFEEGAAIPVNYGTAYQMLHHVGSLKAGETVFVQAAAGGVGLAVLDLAQAVGARVIGVASASKHAYLRERGVAGLVSRDEPLAPAVRRLTDGRGVDVFLDSEGGGGLRQAYDLLAPGGRLICFGVSSMIGGERANWVKAAWELVATPRFSAIQMMNDNKAVAGVNMLTLSKAAPAIYAANLQALMRKLAAGELKPHVHEAVPAERGAEAHRILHERRNVGKVVLTW